MQERRDDRVCNLPNTVEPRRQLFSLEAIGFRANLWNVLAHLACTAYVFRHKPRPFMLFGTPVQACAQQSKCERSLGRSAFRLTL
ncbi:hypothetical protein X992_5231 [Burkholderia pseudomallei MSHR5492]|nr:hypothetical protein X992_5231 [Burkholderia pseudomallei MSHR5492]